MSEYVYAGLTSQTIDIFIQDASSTTGAGLSGLVYNSAGLVASYRKGATGSRVAITLATQTVGGAYSSGGFVEIDATNMAGVYRFDLVNASVDTEGFVTLYLYGATNMVPLALRIDCRALPADTKKWLGTVASTPTVAGVPNVNAKTWNDLTTVALPLIPTTPGRTLDVSAGGEAGIDWANVGSPTTTVALTGTTIGNSSGALSVGLPTVERSPDDTRQIQFTWPVSGATITGTVSIDGGGFGAVAGAISFLYTSGGVHWYRIAYNVADRPAAEGVALYAFVDGTYTRYVALRIAAVSAAEIDLIPKVGRTTRHRNVDTAETADVILEEVP